MDAEILIIINELIKNKKIIIKNRDPDKLSDTIDEIGKIFHDLDIDYIIDVISKDEVKITLDD
ncbi:hypothetical protein P9294_gp095 [Bacillus phage FADO]|uniref:Uncharacterized protein n=1 Tax=Bacillus phage FADO TaxID=2917160 RepID=A0AAE9G6H6_9CAUD|nr:hypothetical protein P9294_gp095 [Bacillus phage FADO]UNY48810.1 hypothetical protein fado_95 [Bacillus phage FADO]